jgi:hypothetical protein
MVDLRVPAPALVSASTGAPAESPRVGELPRRREELGEKGNAGGRRQ